MLRRSDLLPARPAPKGDSSKPWTPPREGVIPDPDGADEIMRVATADGAMLKNSMSPVPLVVAEERWDPWLFRTKRSWLDRLLGRS